MEWMRRIAAAALVGVFVLPLVGCPIAVRPRQPAAPSAPAAPTPPGEPRSTKTRRQPLSLVGTYVHAGSGIEFPGAAAAWARTTSHGYDREGNDIGIGYHRTVGGNRVEMTIYVFPRHVQPDGGIMSLDEEFGLEIEEVRSAWRDARAGERVAADTPFRGAVVPGRAVEFTADDPRPLAGGRVLSFLTTYAVDPWRLKYRCTTYGGNRDEVLAAIAALLAELRLPPLDPSKAASEPR